MSVVARLREVTYLDTRALGVFRMGLGAVVVIDVLRRAVDLEAHYLDQGAVPRALVLAESAPPLAHQLFFTSGQPAWTILLLALLATAGALLSCGRFTRTTTVLCWILFTSLMARDPFVLNFGDRILRLMLFWSMWLPLGARFSLDARRRKDPANAPTPVRVTSIASAAYMLQIVFVYFFGALLKHDPVWLTGQAIEYALHFDQATRPLGHLLAGFPTLMQLLTYATLVIEGFVVLLVFSPWRNDACRIFVVATLALFHVGLGVTMVLGHFPLVCLVAWVVFLPSRVWDRVDAPRPQASTDTAEQQNKRSRGADALALAALALVLAANVASLAGGGRGRLPEPLHSLARVTALDQRWTMFAPKPLRLDGWLVVSGQRRDGRLVDAWTGEEPARWTKPEDPAGRYPNYRWMAYMVKLAVDRDRSEQKVHLASYLCRRWNRSHTSEAGLDFLSIDFVQELTLAGGREGDPIPLKLVRHRCELPPRTESAS